ncbi:RNA polymerase sigma factor [Corynebacterium sp. CCM 8862]|uniref:RNA polymerase sigma factor n=1 Tax=Corynebacterium mendelii TaxID=2765362 RepID=A0A939DZL3_9CORY|nr:RNA polymerase sigma factor [Corynebacterium mendelii]
MQPRDPRCPGEWKIGSSLLVKSGFVSNETERNDAVVTELALAAGRGDRAALTDFIAATHNDVWRLLAHLGGAEIADDLTQETYLRVMSALPRFAARSSARTWILSLARRVWVDNIRHDMARPRKAATQYEDAAATAATSNSWADWVDARLIVEQLAPERREALILTQILGYTYEEAAKIAGCRTGTIRSRVARARADILQAAGTGHDDRPQGLSSVG